MKKIITRVILDILLAIMVLNGWWVPALILVLIGVWAFPYFVEIVIAGIAYDALFGMVPGMVWGGYLCTIISVGLLMFAIIAKKMVR